MFLIPEGSRKTDPHKHDGAFKEPTILKFLEESDSGKSKNCQNNFDSTGGRKKGLLDRFPPFGAGWCRWRPSGLRCIWKQSGMEPSPSCADAVWELVSAVSKTRARLEGNQMLPLAASSPGVPPSSGGMLPHDITARWFTDQ